MTYGKGGYVDTWELLRTNRERGFTFKTHGIVNKADEVIFDLISCMCDNRERLRFVKADGRFSVKLYSGNGTPYALGNLQMDADSHDLVWSADEENWDEVVRIIETGTSLIKSVKSRRFNNG